MLKMASDMRVTTYLPIVTPSNESAFKLFDSNTILRDTEVSLEQENKDSDSSSVHHEVVPRRCSNCAMILRRRVGSSPGTNSSEGVTALARAGEWGGKNLLWLSGVLGLLPFSFWWTGVLRCHVADGGVPACRRLT